MVFKYGQITIKECDKNIEENIYHYLCSIDVSMSLKIDKLINGDTLYIFSDIGEKEEKAYNELIKLCIRWKLINREREISIIEDVEEILNDTI